MPLSQKPSLSQPPITPFKSDLNQKNSLSDANLNNSSLSETNLTANSITHPIATLTTATAYIAPIKTWLFVPATRLDRVAKAFAKGADAVIIDLEDTVAPHDKALARQGLQNYYADGEQRAVWVRINQAGTADFDEDIKLCRQLPQFTGVVLAKAEQAADIEYLHQATSLPIIALIESARGLYQLDSLAKANGVSALSYGFLDLCNDLNVKVGTPAAEIIANQIRYQMLVTSKVHQLWPPIDTIYPDFKDDEGLHQRVMQWSALGMSGMLCIHPNQIEVINQACRPTNEQIEFAKKVVDEYQRCGQAIFQLEGIMVDAPVIERCRQLLARV